MLFTARKRKEETAVREAAGESLWTEDFDERALVRIAEFWRIVAEDADSYNYSLAQHIGALLRIHAGHAVRAIDPETLLRNGKNTHFVLDAIGAVHDVLARDFEHQNWHQQWARAVNTVLREHRIAYKFVEGELIEFSSDELHTEVVEPALRLLVGAKFAHAHGAYMDALKEISRGHAGDAITDAGTALQETLTALGCKGNALGPLIKDAKKNGLLTGHDQNLIDGIAKFMEWASADRSESGDGHKHSKAEVADAWLMVHIVGAIIVRLADPVQRGEPSGA